MTGDGTVTVTLTFPTPERASWLLVLARNALAEVERNHALLPLIDAGKLHASAECRKALRELERGLAEVLPP